MCGKPCTLRELRILHMTADLTLPWLRLRRYGQAGTPQVRIATEYDAAGRTYTVRASQKTPPTSGQAEKGPVPIPIAVGLLGADGQELPLHLKVGGPLRSSPTVLTSVVFLIARGVMFMKLMPCYWKC